MDAAEELKRLAARPANVHPEEVIALARAAGWEVTKGAKHRWKCKKAGRFPFVVANHPGTMKPGTVRRILSIIEEDLLENE